MPRVFFPVLLASALTMSAVSAAEQIDFTEYDRNDDALLSPQEWRQVDHLDVGFEAVDRNDDGWVNRAEIHSLLLEMREQQRLSLREEANRQQVPATGQQAPTRLNQASFEDFDLDDDGRVGRRESKLQETPSIARRFVIWDTDGDRLLDQDEFDRAVADLNRYEVSAEQPFDEQDVRQDEFRVTDFEMWDSDGDGLLDQVRFEKDVPETTQ